ncbi:MAG TPA: sulfate ABC transporter substrate-binding protein [Actinomycetota bacterium]|nr:sulfate ABC transporter substrate-binding protein [Actinomycetota bacterium]
MRRTWTRFTGAAAALAVGAAACGTSSGSTVSGGGKCVPTKTPVITFAAYSTPREVYGKIIPAFQADWKEKHNGQNVIFQESYGGSTTQAQNVVNGFPADVVALSLAPDVDTIEQAGLITHDWTQAADGGMVSTSVVVFDVRPGNPKAITDWEDLTKPGVQVLTPDPAQSGGARWNIVAAYGAAERGKAARVVKGAAGALSLLTGVFSNVTVLDKSARDSIKNFESGNGDVALTYENEVLTAQKARLPDQMVIPPSTVLIENPVAVVDQNAEKHCVTDVADAFVDFLHTQDAKDLYTSVGFLRPTNAADAAKGDGDTFAPIEDLFTVADLGGWDQIDQKVFGTAGIFTNAFKAAQG